MKKIFFLAACFYLTGCDLFTTRPAEPPDTPKSDFQPAFLPEILIDNFINSLKDKNIENYLSCISDSSDEVFTFSPSSEALSQFPALGDNWSKNNESQYLNNLKIKIPDDKPLTLTLTNFSYNVQGENTRTFVASYTLSFTINDVTVPSYYEGELIFELIRNSKSTWSIYFWRDIKSSNSPSWSELKGRFY